MLSDSPLLDVHRISHNQRTLEASVIDLTLWVEVEFGQSLNRTLKAVGQNSDYRLYKTGYGTVYWPHKQGESL